MNYIIPTIWLLIFLIFSSFTIYHNNKLKTNLNSLTSLKTIKNAQMKLLGVDFNEMLQIFKDELNQLNKESHLIARNSYSLAALVSLVSLFFSLVN